MFTSIEFRFNASEAVCSTYMVNLVGNAKVSPLRPWCVLARGVATVFSAPARIITKNECLVDSEIIGRIILTTSSTTTTQRVTTSR